MEEQRTGPTVICSYAGRRLDRRRSTIPIPTRLVCQMAKPAGGFQAMRGVVQGTPWDAEQCAYRRLGRVRGVLVDGSV